MNSIGIGNGIGMSAQLCIQTVRVQSSIYVEYCKRTTIHACDTRSQYTTQSRSSSLNVLKLRSDAYLYRCVCLEQRGFLSWLMWWYFCFSCRSLAAPSNLVYFVKLHPNRFVYWNHCLDFDKTRLWNACTQGLSCNAVEFRRINWRICGIGQRKNDKHLVVHRIASYLSETIVLSKKNNEHKGKPAFMWTFEIPLSRLIQKLNEFLLASLCQNMNGLNRQSSLYY